METKTTVKTETQVKAQDVKGVKKFFTYKQGDIFDVPVEIKKAYPDMEFHFYLNNFDAVRLREGMGWEVVQIPQELKDRIRVRRSVTGQNIDDQWIVGDQVLMMRPKEEMDELRKRNELKYRKLSSSAANELKREVKTSMPYDAPVDVEEYKSK